MRRLSIVLALLAAPPAAAAVSPEEVWQTWRAGGVTLEAAERREEDGTLVLGGVTVALEGGERMMIDRLILAPEGEAVRVTAAPEARLVIPDAGSEGRLEAPGASLRVTGAPGALVYDLAAARAALDWPEAAGLAIAFMGLSGRIEPAAAGIAADLSAELGTLDLTVEGAGGATTATQRFTAPVIGYDGPLDPRPDTPAEIRFEAEGTQIVTEREDTAVTFESKRSEAHVRTTGARIDLSQRYESGQATVTTPGDKPPLALDIAALSLDLEAPFVAGAAAAPATFGLAMDGVELDEATRARIDPEGTLPRGPGALALGLRADLAPGTGLAAGEAPARRLERLRIDEARIEALGAAVAAEGTLVFPAPDAPGAPARPEGVIDVTFTDAARLLDDLAAVGLIGEGEALFARFGLGQVTRPGDGPQDRVAEIVFGPDGAISIGGLTLR